MKRFLSLALAIVLMLTLLPCTASAAAGDKLVALTFDDGPSNLYTGKLLDGLKQRGVHVTFFMTGQNASGNPDLVRRAYDEGHEVANHSYSHPNLNTVGYSGVQSQIGRTNAVLDKACGAGTEYIVRPPYGNANSTVLSALNAPAIIWSVDTRDWESRNSTKVYNHIVNDAYDGAIILCHDIHSTTIPAALSAVDTLMARGYEFVTVSELYRRRGVSMRDGVTYKDCKPNGTDLGSVQAPVITYEPDAGGVRITITSPSGAPVYYSTDGSRLTQTSTRYTKSFVTTCPVKIRAVAAFNLNGGRSKETTFELNLLPCAQPRLKLTGDQMTLSCDTKGAPIYYTLDGSKPTVKSAKYAAPVTVQPDTVIRAIAGGDTYVVSQELSLYYSENRNLFADVYPNQWFADTIDRLVTMGIMDGIGNYAFAPDADTTRGMVVTLLYRFSGQTLEDGWSRTNTFTDVAGDEWFAEAIEWACINQVVDGYPDGTFKPDQSISRQEMAQMIDRFLDCRGNTLPAGEDCRKSFTDGDAVAQWALDSVNAMVAAGLMKGNDVGCLEPEDTATRAEFATVLVRMMELEEKMEQEREEAVEQEPDEEETESTENTEPAGQTGSTEPAGETV